MKKRVCFIGNSHLAAIKVAWDRFGDEFSDLQATFFGSRGRSLDNLRLSGRRLIPLSKGLRANLEMTSGGLSEIHIDEYDVFVLHGLALSFEEIIKELLLPHAPVEVDVKAHIEASTAFNLASMLSAHGKSAILSPTPMVSENVLARGREWSRWRDLVDADGRARAGVELCLQQWHSLLGRYGGVTQPQETISNAVFTRSDYSSNATIFRNGGRAGENDVLHMNADYGREVLRVLAKRIREGAEEQVGVTPLSTPAHPRGEDASHARAKRHPYAGLPDRCFWRRTVSTENPLAIGGWYTKKFELVDRRIATAGSCFAQHIGRRLRQAGFSYVDMEPPPADLSPAKHAEHGYGLYSGRYGNIYSARQLRQLLERATGKFTPTTKAWKRDDGFVDPFRPTIQPEPFGSVEDVLRERKRHLEAVRELFSEAEVFVFTLGMTEAWESVEDGAVFPVAPGVSGGAFDPRQFRFINCSFNEVLDDMRAFVKDAREINPGLHLVLTVSPVPLMATASTEQVVVANTRSKSVLRAVAGQLAERRAFIDYFPSYEIVNSHVMGGRFYSEDMRGISDEGVEHVMRQFFAEHKPPVSCGEHDEPDESVRCDEELLAAFGPRPRAAD